MRNVIDYITNYNFGHGLQFAYAKFINMSVNIAKMICTVLLYINKYRTMF